MGRDKASSLVAIAVGQGDAFYLTRAGIRALIDGGRSIDSFPQQFQRAVGQKAINVVVCTHNDADHANGVLGILRSGLPCREVWLPGSWTDHLIDVMRHPEAFFDELISDVDSAKLEEAETGLEDTLWMDFRLNDIQAKP